MYRFLTKKSIIIFYSSKLFLKLFFNRKTIPNVLIVI